MLFFLWEFQYKPTSHYSGFRHKKHLYSCPLSLLQSKDSAEAVKRSMTISLKEQIFCTYLRFYTSNDPLLGSFDPALALNSAVNGRLGEGCENKIGHIFEDQIVPMRRPAIF